MIKKFFQRRSDKMELKKQPETEVEYWEAIEGLGGYIWSTNHGLCHSHIEDKDGKVVESIKEAVQISERLVVEIGKKFGVIHPRDCPKVEPGQPIPPPPDGKVYYRDWYCRMKSLFIREDYEGIICSACPFSKGLQFMIALGGVVPCGIISGAIYRLSRPYECNMLHSNDWDTEKLYKEIVRKAGPNSLTQFQEKEKELENRFKQKSQ